MGSRGKEDSGQGGGWQTQRGGQLWNGEGQATASRSHKVVAGRPWGPTSSIDTLGGTAGDRSRLRNPRLKCREIKAQTSD